MRELPVYAFGVYMLREEYLSLKESYEALYEAGQCMINSLTEDGKVSAACKMGKALAMADKHNRTEWGEATGP